MVPGGEAADAVATMAAARLDGNVLLAVGGTAAPVRVAAAALAAAVAIKIASMRAGGAGGEDRPNSPAHLGALVRAWKYLEPCYQARPKLPPKKGKGKEGRRRAPTRVAGHRSGRHYSDKHAAYGKRPDQGGRVGRPGLSYASPSCSRSSGNFDILAAAGVTGNCPHSRC